MDASKRKSVYTIVDKNGRSFWVKLGTGFVNGDGSINVKLYGPPANGTLQIRDDEGFGHRGGAATTVARTTDRHAPASS